MAERVITVNDDFDLPTSVTQRQASRLGNPETAEGAALQRAVAPKLDTASINNPASQPVNFEQFPFAATGVVAANTAVIAQDTITTAPNGNSYAVYWDANLEPRIAVKAPSVGTWSTYPLAGAPGSTLTAMSLIDDHRNIVVAVDGDGYIHISADHHVDPLRYIRSAKPYDVTAWVAPGMTGVDEERVTYPQFVRTGSGDLLFFWRNGDGSGDGDHFVNKYTKATRTWARVAQIFVGTQPTVNPNQCAYITNISRHASTGRLHLFYTWRDTPDETTNHDFGYIYSDDDGATWRTADGAAQALPISPSNSAPFILTGRVPGLVNQCGASVDSDGSPHAILRLGTSGAWTLNHIYRDGSKWVNEVVYSSTSALGRPGLYSTTSGKTYALYARADRPRALRVSPTVGAEVTLYNHGQRGWQPSYDAHAPANRLRVMLSPASLNDPSYESTYAGILSVDMTQVDSLPASRYVAPPTASPKAAAGVATVERVNAIGMRYEPAAAIGSTMDRRMIANGPISALTSGTLRLNAIWLPKNAMVSSLSFLAGASATGTPNRWFALYSGAGRLLRVSADDTASWAAGSVRTLPLTSSYKVPEDGIYYAAICETADTCTQLRGVTGNSNALGLPPTLAANGTSGLTRAATAPASTSLTAVSWLAYAYAG